MPRCPEFANFASFWALKMLLGLFPKIHNFIENKDGG